MNRFKDKLKRGFIHHRNYLQKGMGEIYAFRAIFMTLTAAGIGLKYLFSIELPTIIYITAGVAFSLSCWTIGWLWDKTHMYDVEADWGNKRNPAIRKLLKRKA